MPLVLIVGLLVYLSCWLGPVENPSADDDVDNPPTSHPLSKVVKDNRDPFQIDPTKPFRIELGRGSGMHGLNTVKIDENGTVVLTRLYYQRFGESIVSSWKRAELRLHEKSLRKLIKAVESNDLMKLERSYHADVVDGTQWVLWIKQGNHEKSVYFDNHFPRPILRFSAHLDDILAEAGLVRAAWCGFPGSESGNYDRELWNSIRR